MNKVVLLGRLSADPKLSYSTKGTAICRFTVAVTRRFSNQNGEREADFISCTAWSKTAEFVGEYFKKGKMIAIEGHLQVSSFEKDGERKWSTEVIVDQAEFAGDRETSNSSYQPKQPAQNQSYEAGLGENIVFSDDELKNIFGEQM